MPPKTMGGEYLEKHHRDTTFPAKLSSLHQHVKNGQRGKSGWQVRLSAWREMYLLFPALSLYFRISSKDKIKTDLILGSRRAG